MIVFYVFKTWFFCVFYCEFLAVLKKINIAILTRKNGFKIDQKKAVLFLKQL